MSTDRDLERAGGQPGDAGRGASGQGASGFVRRVGRVAVLVPRYLVLVPVYLYRWLVSPMLPDTCIYTPSCSEYTVRAIRRHGALKGLVLGTARVSRCTGGFFDGGYDPVPERFSFAEIKAGYSRHRRGRAGRHEEDGGGV